uniref:Uncharacterized protein n=1 Tax=Calcidiscus leptoporus TaxID=127549 RepID=A0A7S0J065_9EUKA
MALDPPTSSSRLDYNSILEQGKMTIRETFSRTREKGEELINTLGITKDDLSKLERVPLICAFASLIINIMLILSIYSQGWVKGTAMYNGEPFTVHASLSDVTFNSVDGQRDLTSKIAGCSDVCHLNDLSGGCTEPVSGTTYPISGTLMTTSPVAWCQLSTAGGATFTLLWVGLVPGLLSIFATAIFAAKEIEKVGKIFDMIEAKGFTPLMQKIVLSLCWGALWICMFVAMVTFSAGVPDSLGIGHVEFESSFGFLRLCFLLISGFGALLITSLFELWHADKVAEAYAEFAETKLFSAKKALYYLLFVQGILYLLLSIKEMHWEVLLVVIAGYYLDAKVENFKLLYIATVSVTILLDIVRIGGFPSFDTMTPGQSFTGVLFIITFLSKFFVLAAIYFYEKEKEQFDNGHEFEQFDLPDEIAE